MTRGASLPGRLLLAAIASAAVCGNAGAHTTMEGANHFTGGILHPLMTPAHVLILLGLGISLGQHVPLRTWPLSRVFAPIAATALALTATGHSPITQPAALAAIALCAGTVVALGKRPPAIFRTALYAAAALGLGLDSGVESGSAGAVVTTLLGTWIGLVLFLFAIGFYASQAAARQTKWLDIALRVAGSWIVAISVLMLAFALRK